MVAAVLADFARCNDCHVVTTWDRGLEPLGRSDVATHRVASPDEERALFERLAAECDATFVIAPESQGILAKRRDLVDCAGRRFLGCGRAAIELCGDKLALAGFLRDRSIPTIDTSVVGSEREREFSFPMVVKPRDGAGSQDTWLIENEETRQQVRRRLKLEESEQHQQWIVQPFVSGLPLSVAVFVDQGDSPVFCPIAEQRLSCDGRFRYCGGKLPAAIVPSRQHAIIEVARAACAAVPELSGYVGIDLVCPRDDSQPPLIVELNPRLTTSYLGYRALADENLAERLLGRGESPPKIRWQRREVEYTPDGTVTICCCDSEK
jgi:predicted ATP-grasp superfamily ATP-dependent carboligase